MVPTLLVSAELALTGPQLWQRSCKLDALQSVTYWQGLVTQCDSECVLLVAGTECCVSFRFLWPCIVSKIWKEKTNKMQELDVYYYYLLSQRVSGIIMPIFRRLKALLLHLVLFWVCWMWLVAVVGRCLAALVLTSCKTAPHDRYQPHPAEPEQHTKCSNRSFVLLKMGIMMPETWWDRR
jgi:hypothetical protein